METVFVPSQGWALGSIFGSLARSGRRVCSSRTAEVRTIAMEKSSRGRGGRGNRGRGGRGSRGRGRSGQSGTRGGSIVGRKKRVPATNQPHQLQQQQQEKRSRRDDTKPPSFPEFRGTPDRFVEEGHAQFKEVLRKCYGGFCVEGPETFNPKVQHSRSTEI